MRRTIPVLVLTVGAAVVAAIGADAIRHDTLTPIWEMAWLPGVVAAAMYRPGERRRRACRERCESAESPLTDSNR